MIKITEPFIYASAYITKNTKGKDDCEKTETTYKLLLNEIENADSCLEDVVAVHRFQTESFDGKSTRDAYIKYFKPVMPLNTAVTLSKLEQEDAICKITLTAIKGSCKNEKWQGVSLIRKNFSSGSPLESVLGYSRMVKVGPFILIGGTTSVLPDGSVAGSGNSEAQDVFIWSKLISLLEKAGASECDIVKVKKYITPEYHASGNEMPEDDSLKPYTIAEPVAKLTRAGQLLEVEIAAVASKEILNYDIEFE